MTDFPSYTLGTVSVSNGDIAIVGDGTIWTGINARAGDTIVIGTSRALVVDVTDDTHLKIDAWPFTTVTAGTSYKIIQNSPLRFVGGQAMADVSSLIAVLRANGLLWYLPEGYTDPNDIVPALTADDGQAILRIDTGALWVMSGGTWVSAGTYKGFQYKGAYNPATAYVVNDVITSGGSAYIVTASTSGNAPPNSSYYDLLASKGDTGTISVGTVTTGAGGSSAVVTNVGTSTTAIFDFTIPAGKNYSGTSTTSLAIGTGSKVFTTQSGLAYTNGARVRASSAANTANWMEGLVTYSGTTLTMTSVKTNGSGTLADWNLNVVGEPGAGDVSSANQLTDVTVLADGTGAVARTAADKFKDFVSITDFGAKGDGVNVTATVSITSGTSALTATGAVFTAVDVGKTIVVPGAGAAGVELITTIASFTDATHVGLTANASTTLAAVSKTIFYGTDNTTAINNALAASATVMIPNGNFGHSGTISIATSDSFLVGMGRGSTILTSTSKTLPAIQSGLGITNWGVRHLTTTRAPVATSGATGIYQPSSNDHGYIDDLLVTKHYVGLIFTYTGYSRFTHSDVSFNVSHGVQCVPDTSGGTVFQWNLDDILSSQNGGDGFNIDASGGTGGAPMGNWVHVSSFLNTGVAMRFLGSASNAITNIRIAECFVGGDGGPAEIVLDTYNSDGFPHTFTDCCLELGSGGFSISTNNGPVILNNPWIEGMTGNGIVAGGAKLVINGGHITYNATGVSVQAGRLQVSNCIISNVSGGSAQQYGIAFAASTGPHLVRGCDFTYGLPNAISAIFGASTIVAGSKIESNIGYNPVGGGVVTTGGAQPYSYTAGPSAEDAYISVPSGAISGATVNGGNILPVGIAANVIFSVKLPPGGTLVISGSFTTGTLVHCRFIH